MRCRVVAVNSVIRQVGLAALKVHFFNAPLINRLLTTIFLNNWLFLAEIENFLFLLQITATMKWLKLTAFASLAFASLSLISSCEKDAEEKKVSQYEKTGIVMSGAQETPAVATSALGSMDVKYVRGSRTLAYKITWAGLADTITGMHIHGLAPVGYAAPVFQTILSTRNEAAFPFRGGSYSGTLLVDGIVVKEENLIGGLYYINIHTKTYPGGEIRGQIRFQ